MCGVLTEPTPIRRCIQCVLDVVDAHAGPVVHYCCWSGENTHRAGHAGRPDGDRSRCQAEVEVEGIKMKMQNSQDSISIRQRVIKQIVRIADRAHERPWPVLQ